MPHGLGLRVPLSNGGRPVVFTSNAQLRRRDVLGGLIHEYNLAASMEPAFLCPSPRRSDSQYEPVAA